LLVKRLEQRIRFVDQILNPLRRRVLSPVARENPERNVRKGCTERNGADSDADPKERAREAPVVVTVEAFLLRPWVRLHLF
jgi:hypothetical protein